MPLHRRERTQSCCDNAAIEILTLEADGLKSFERQSGVVRTKRDVTLIGEKTPSEEDYLGNFCRLSGEPLPKERFSTAMGTTLPNGLSGPNST